MGLVRRGRAATPEPVTAEAARPVRRPLLTVRWRDLAFVHGPVEPAAASRLPGPSDLERFLTARWGLHAAWYGGRLCYLPNQHPPWPLHRAALLRLEENLLTAAGLPPPGGEPVSVLYSPGVPVRMGLPRRSFAE